MLRSYLVNVANKEFRLDQVLLLYRLTHCIDIVMLIFLTVVVSQQFIVEVHNEHVIRGNSATLRCVIPAFVADFLSVSAWIDSDEGSYTAGTTFG